MLPTDAVIYVVHDLLQVSREVRSDLANLRLLILDIDIDLVLPVYKEVLVDHEVLLVAGHCVSLMPAGSVLLS